MKFQSVDCCCQNLNECNQFKLADELIFCPLLSGNQRDIEYKHCFDSIQGCWWMLTSQDNW